MKFDDSCARYWICRCMEKLFGFSPNQDSIVFSHFCGKNDFLSAKFNIKEGAYMIIIDVHGNGRFVSCRLELEEFGVNNVTMQRYDIYGTSNGGKYDISSQDYFNEKG